MEVIKGRRSIITASISEAGGVLDLTGFIAKLVIASRPGAEAVASITGSILAPLTGVIIFTLLPDSLIAAEAKHYRIVSIHAPARGATVQIYIISN